MKFSHLSEQAQKVLIAVGTFHYMTTEHLIGLEGLAASENSLQSWALRSLRPPGARKADEPKATCIRPYLGLAEKHRHKPFYYLTDRGQAYLVHNFEDRFYEREIWRRGTNETICKITNDYDHRSAYVWLHMCLRGWVDQKGWYVNHDMHYYQGIAGVKERGKRPPSRTMAYWGDPEQDQKIIADGLFSIDMDDKTRLFAVEMSKATESRMAFRQLYKYYRAIPGFKEKFPGVSDKIFPYILSVHAQEHVFQSVRKRVATDPNFEGAQNRIFFARLSDLKTNFGSAWTYADGSLAPIFQ